MFKSPNLKDWLIHAGRRPDVSNALSGRVASIDFTVEADGLKTTHSNETMQTIKSATRLIRRSISRPVQLHASNRSS